MYYLKNIWYKVRYSSFLRIIFDGFAKSGIRITPYFVVLEGLLNSSLSHLEAGFFEYKLDFLNKQDMVEISQIPGQRVSLEELTNRLKENKICYGAKHNGKIVGFTWCDFSEFYFKFYKFRLKDDEAYLFDAFTLPAYRGKGIAPYLRYQFYKILKNFGKHQLLSVSDSFNTPSIKFKKKLNAKMIELRLLIIIFKKWNFDFHLKSYDF